MKNLKIINDKIVWELIVTSCLYFEDFKVSKSANNNVIYINFSNAKFNIKNLDNALKKYNALSTKKYNITYKKINNRFFNFYLSVV